MGTSESKGFEPYWIGPGYRGEYQCIHGVGHGTHVHGCDGCCSRPDFPLNKENIKETRLNEPRKGHTVNKRDQKLKEKKRQPKSPGPITRRQQTEALRQVKGYEIASAVSNTIRSAVQQEVETQLKVVWDAMIDLIKRSSELGGGHEGDGNNRSERTEAPAVQQDDQVVQGEVVEGTDCSSPDAT